jgi:ion channel POLLUX/CASTOR
VRRGSLKHRFSYALERMMSKGSVAMIGTLAALCLFLVLVMTAVVAVAGLAPATEGHRPGLVRDFFITGLHAVDPGAIAHEAIGEDVTSWRFLVAMLIVTLGGLLIISALIGVLATGLEERMRSMRKGRSPVLESGHTLILGWSTTIFTVIAELVLANESEERATIVVLAPRDKVEMEDDLVAKVHDFKTTRLIVRSGNPGDPDDLALVSPAQAKSVIVLAEDVNDPDGQVLKAILALTIDAEGGEGEHHIVGVITDSTNLEAAALVGRDHAVFIDRRDTIARLMIQAARQPGVSLVYRELLQYEGDEIYFREDPSFVGEDYGKALFAYENASTIGILHEGEVILNPPSERRILAGDSLIAIAEDDSTLMVSPRFEGTPEDSAMEFAEVDEVGSMRILMIGWNGRAPTMIDEIDKYAPPGAELMIATEFGDPEAEIASRTPPLRNLSVEVEVGNTSQNRRLEQLHPETYDQIIVLCYGDHLGYEEADAKTLITLFHLRDLGRRLEVDLRIATEMLDDRNRKLADVAHVDDIVVSDEFVSLLLSQVSETEQLAELFEQLFAVGGPQFYLRPAAAYVRPGATVKFATVIEAARRRGETAIGFRIAAQARDAERSYGVCMNPAKSSTVEFAPEDAVVVLACEGVSGQGEGDNLGEASAPSAV